MNDIGLGEHAALQIIIALTIIFLMSLIIYWKSEKILFSIFVFSLAGNLLVYYNVNLHFAIFYNAMWLFKFARNIWPYINMALIVLLAFNFLKNKYSRKKKIGG